VVSDELDDHADGRAHQQGLPPYTIHKPVDGKYEIRAIPWKQLVRTARARHDHLEKWLNYSVKRERVFELAEETYAMFMPPPQKKKKPR